MEGFVLSIDTHTSQSEPQEALPHADAEEGDSMVLSPVKSSTVRQQPQSQLGQYRDSQDSDSDAEETEPESEDEDNDGRGAPPSVRESNNVVAMPSLQQHAKEGLFRKPLLPSTKSRRPLRPHKSATFDAASWSEASMQLQRASRSSNSSSGSHNSAVPSSSSVMSPTNAGMELFAPSIRSSLASSSRTRSSSFNHPGSSLPQNKPVSLFPTPLATVSSSSDEGRRRSLTTSNPLKRKAERSPVVATTSTSGSGTSSLPLKPRLPLSLFANLSISDEASEDNGQCSPTRRSSFPRKKSASFRLPSPAWQEQYQQCSGRGRSVSANTDSSNKENRQQTFLSPPASPMGPSQCSPYRAPTALFAKAEASSKDVVPSAQTALSPYSNCASASATRVRSPKSPTSITAECAAVGLCGEARPRTRASRALTFSCGSISTRPPFLQTSAQSLDLLHKPHGLPTLPNASPVDLPCIDAATLVNLIDGRYSHMYSQHYIIDCRFEYEYEGGHIQGALNMTTTQCLEKMFMTNPSPLKERVCIVFHCEFSSHRGPTLCRYLRSWDRKAHEHCYPELFYPELYVLEGGYKKFWESEVGKPYCVPQQYLPMRDDRFSKEMKSGLAVVKHMTTVKKSRSFRSRSWTVDTSSQSLKPLRFPSLTQPDLSQC